MSDNNLNAVSQLPLEFKLYYQGKHVGYENHEISTDMPYLGLEILQSLDGIKWNFAYSTIRATGTRWIIHDEKRQYTGFQDKNGDKIYFGDKLRISEDNLLFTVVLEGGRIFAVRSDMSPGFGANSFQSMEKEGK